MFRRLIMRLVVNNSSVLSSGLPASHASTDTEASRAIRTWRQRTGLTQEGLAQALNVTFSTVSRWENGHVKPSKLAWKALTRVAATCGVPFDWPRTAESPAESDLAGNPRA
jgi:putative transcriptional regulator